MHVIRAAAVRALLAGFVAAGSSAHAADKLQGTFSLDAHKETLAHGLAWVDSKGQVSAGFYTADLTDPKDVARALKGEGAIYGLFDKPNATVSVHFKAGTTQASPAAVDYCNVVFEGFALGPFTMNSDAKGCGIVELSGAVKPGGVIHGKLKGTAEAMPRSDGHKPAYAWDVDFTAALRAKP